ncbi:histidine--tRNA ligase, partial [Candidatus Bathyarchaeota archaeon]|nr:histidine--tRNA ligase [Candidatus Bathyarchaeota archaeon]
MSELKPVRGMRDLLPKEAQMLRNVEEKARKVAELYGYKEIVTPVVESYDLLSAKAGEEVKSRMFLFKDLGGRDVALRPEFTASVARLVATTLRNEPKPLRLFCVGSVYRYDEPQRGRYREFWQSNYELMGSNKPEADAEILVLTNCLLQQTGLTKYAFKVGHIGVLKGLLSQEKVDEKVQNAVMQLMDKKQHNDAIALLEESGTPQKCISIIRRLVELKGANTLEIVDSIKNLVDGYEQSVEAARNLGEILALVSRSGCKIDITVEAGFARGLEYYTGMIFETYAPDLDIALGGGGRYNRLIQLFGGEPAPAVGVAHGIDRIMLGLQMQKTREKSSERKAVMVVPTKDELMNDAFRIAQSLRQAVISAELEVMGRKMVKALEVADKKNTAFAVIVG